MASNVQLKFRKNSYTSQELLTLCQTAGNVIFDNNTKRIYVGTENSQPAMFGPDIRDIQWNNSTSVLTVNKVDGTSLILNLSDATSSEVPTSILSGIRDDVNENTEKLLP